MCGILFCCCDFDTDSVSKSALGRRGPDAFNVHRIDSCSEKGNPQMVFCGCVLHHRGDRIGQQPLTGPGGNVFLWNGEVFGGLPDLGNENDTEFLLKTLEESLQGKEEVFSRQVAILQVFEKVRGPYAFIFFDNVTSRLYFGRDALGRRSLLIGRDSNRRVWLSSTISTLPTSRYEEVPAVGLFMTSLNSDAPLRLLPWDLYVGENCIPPQLVGIEVVLESEPALSSGLLPGDSFFIPAPLPPHPPSEGQDMSNLPTQAADYHHVTADTLTYLLNSAVRTRVRNTSSSCAECHRIRELDGCAHAKVAVLFSGGLDSTTLALMADSWLPPDDPIDLLNVAFEQRPPRRNPLDKKRHRRKEVVESPQSSYDVPDRLTGLSSLAELKELRPNRRWNFVQIDVTISELQEERRNRIGALVRPLTSVLDDSLGCALWFAARGKGKVEGFDYTSRARLVLSGLGADEQLAGYSRHRYVFDRAGWDGVEEELKMEMRRIGSRNLGRDDRVIADHGREARFPYLDEDVVSFIASCPAHVRANFYLGKGIGEKFLLRLVAWKLGLRGAALQPKRALQFGSKIAKAEGGSGERGGQICARLMEDCGEEKS